MLLTPLVFAGPREPGAPDKEGEAKQADDPLPEGAKVRFGVTRPILRTTPTVALVPPSYTTMIAPTMTGGVRLYDVGTGRPLEKTGIVGPGLVIVSGDGKRAAVARPGSLTVVEVATGKQLLAVEPPDGILLVGVPGAALSDDGKVLAYGARGRDRKGAAVVVDVDKNEVLAQVETAQAAPIYPELSGDGKTLATHGPPLAAPTANPAPAVPKPPVLPGNVPDAARTAQVWEVAGGKELFKARVTGMGGVVVAAAFSANGDRLVLSAGDGPVDVWDVKTGKRLQTLLGRKAQGARVAISPDGKTIASIGPDYRLQRWGIDGKQYEMTQAPSGIPAAVITGLKFADNERVVTWLTFNQFLFAWDATASQLLSPEMTHSAAIRSIAIPADGKNVLTSGLDGKVFGWDLATGESNDSIHLLPARIPGQPLINPVVTLSADGTRAVWPHTPVTEIFDVSSGHNLFVVPPPSSPQAVLHVGTSPDGMKLITVSRQAATGRNGACVIWDLATQQRIGEFSIVPSGNAAAPTPILSSDNTRLAIVTLRNQPGRSALLFVGYDVKTGKKLAEVEEDVLVPGSISIAAADPSSIVVASGSGRLYSVNFEKGRVGADFDNIPARGEPPVNAPVVFSADGKRFAICVVGEPFTTYGVRVYDWPQKKLLHTFLGHRGPVSALQFSSDGNFLATGSQDSSVLLWDLTKLAEGK
jgi:WD40 repeat protein